MRPLKCLLFKGNVPIHGILSQFHLLALLIV